MQLLTCRSHAHSEGAIVQRPRHKHCCVYSRGVRWDRCCLRFARVSFSLFAIVVVLLGYISPLGGGERSWKLLSCQDTGCKTLLSDLRYYTSMNHRSPCFQHFGRGLSRNVGHAPMKWGLDAFVQQPPYTSHAKLKSGGS